jgi:sugar phosphate isomerase/epimerase
MLKLATKFRPDDPHAFDIASRAGYRAAELWLSGKLLTDWQKLASNASKYSFFYALHFPNHGVLLPDKLENVARLYRALNCRAMVIHQAMYDQYGQTLLALEPSLCLAVENHDLAATKFDRWVARNRWLTLDVEHVWKHTLQDSPLETLLSFLEKFLLQHGGKLRHVHLPGYQVGNRDHRPIHYGEEMATAVLSLLADRGFSELVVSEADAEYQNLDELRQDVAMFERWSRRCSSQGAVVPGLVGDQQPAP